MTRVEPSREVTCADALEWMPKNWGLGAVVTSLPDANEMGISVAEWRRWFVTAAAEAMRCAHVDAPAIFYQTDRKVDGGLQSKADLLFQAADQTSARILWHKIVLRRGVGGIDLHRPGFIHLIATSRNLSSGKATADVMDLGDAIYKNGMGLVPARFAVEHAGRYSRTIVDPFCGRGTILAVANALGLDAIGVDISESQCAASRRLRVRALPG